MCEGVRFDSQPIQARLHDLEDRSSRNNLHFEGISEICNVNLEQTAKHNGKFAKDKLGIQGDICLQRAHRVGSSENNN